MSTSRSAVHDTFTLERTYDATPARVFDAWARADAKARWFIGPEPWRLLERALDFRVGGREVLKGAFTDGPLTLYEAVYQDIVPDRRIVYAYRMSTDDKLISVSLATVQFQAAGGGTRLVLTEQGAFLDGFEDGGGRARGTASHLDRLGAVLAR